jgi:hypothetical protein
VTVFHRPNKKVIPYVKFDISPYKKLFSPDRMTSMVVKDAIVDPHATIDRHVDPLDKDPGYKELGKRNTREHDMKFRIIHDE